MRGLLYGPWLYATNHSLFVLVIDFLTGGNKPVLWLLVDKLDIQLLKFVYQINAGVEFGPLLEIIVINLYDLPFKGVAGWFW